MKKYTPHIQYLVLLLLMLIPSVAISQQLVINPGSTQCDASRQGIRIEIMTNGNIQVFYKAHREFYGYMNTFFRINNNTASSTACSYTPVMGTGTAADPYKVILTHQVNDVTITQTVTYVYPNNYYLLDFEVIAGATATNDVSILVRQDTGPGSDDYGHSYADRAAYPRVIASYNTPTSCHTVRTSCGVNNPRYPASTVWKTAPEGFTSFAAGHYSTNCGAPTGAQSSFTNHLSASTVCQDVGLAAHWNLGNFTARQSKTRRMLVGFGNTVSDFNSITVAHPPAQANGSTPVNVSFSSNAFSINEGDNTHVASGITVTISGGILNAAQSMKISAANITATNVDYELISNAFTIPAGNYTTPKTITLNNVSIKGNTTVQNNRSFRLTLDAVGCGALAIPTGTTSTEVTIVDDDTPTVSLTKLADIATCGTNTAVYRINLSKASPSTTTVTLTTTGSTATPSDFSAMTPAGWFTASGTSTITVPANTTAYNISLTAKGDNIIGNPKVVNARITAAVTNGKNATISPNPNDRVAINIADCDNNTTNKKITLTVTPNSINRGTGTGTTATISAKLPTGITTTNAIVITLTGTGATSYSYSAPTITIPATANVSTTNVTLSASCGVAANQTLTISGTATGYTFTPATATIKGVSHTPALNGNLSVCGNSLETYTTDAGKTGYVWTATGGTIQGASNGSSVSVKWNATGTGSITVNYANENGCLAVTPTTKAATINALPTPTITGNTNVCASSTETYTTETGMTGYTWNVTGGTIKTGAGTRTITVEWGSAGTGSVSVNYTNNKSCTAASATVKNVTIKARPTPAISGPSNTINGVNVVYTTETGKTGYTWAITNGTIVSGQGTNSVTVRWTAVGAGTISVNYTDNGCNAVTPTTKNIQIATAKLTLTIAPIEIEEGGSAATATLSLPANTAAPAGGITVSLARNASSTAVNADYKLNNGGISSTGLPTTIVIPQGQREVSFNIGALADNLVEYNETLTIDATATGFNGDQKTLTIKDKTDGTIIVEHRNDASEPNTNGKLWIGFKENVTCTKNVKVTYNILNTSTAAEGTDFNSLTPHEITITNGTRGTDLNVNVKNNFTVEGARTLSIELTSATPL